MTSSQLSPEPTSPEDAAKGSLLQHVTGYRVEVPAKLTSQEPLPVIRLATFNSVDVGTGTIRAVERAGDGGIVLSGSGARNGIAELTHRVKDGPPDRAREPALAAWKRFKGKYSQGGMAGPSSESKLFDVAGRLAGRAGLGWAGIVG